MGDLIRKFVSGFSYGSGLILAVVCAVYATNQYSNSSMRVTSAGNSMTSPNANELENIQVLNVSKLSTFANYAGEGRKEEFIFTGELKNNSKDSSYEKLVVEIDLYDSENKFIYKCGGWDGSGLKLMAKGTATFQRLCHNMPKAVAAKYQSHNVVVNQRRF